VKLQSFKFECHLNKKGPSACRSSSESPSSSGAWGETSKDHERSPQSMQDHEAQTSICFLHFSSILLPYTSILMFCVRLVYTVYTSRCLSSLQSVTFHSTFCQVLNVLSAVQKFVSLFQCTSDHVGHVCLFKANCLPAQCFRYFAQIFTQILLQVAIVFHQKIYNVRMKIEL